MKILVTRPEPDATAFAARCREAGLEVEVSPLLSIEVITEKLGVSRDMALAFTSANGVRAFCANNDVRSHLVFAVGEVTAQAACEHGFSDIEIAQGDVASLAILIANRGSEKEILHISGQAAAGDLVQVLRSKNISAERKVLYRAVAMPGLSDAAVSQIQARQIDYVTVFSPRTARLLKSAIEKQALTPFIDSISLVCLSENVRNELCDFQWKSAMIAPASSSAAMINTIIQADE